MIVSTAVRLRGRTSSLVARCLAALAATILVAVPPGGSSARADQPLISTPFPSQLGSGAAEFDATSRVRRHQKLVPTPYLRSLGPNALGDPAPQKRRRHQKPVKTPYPRQFR